MQAYRDYIGGHKLEFLPRLKGCQKYPSPTSMSPTSMTHVIYLLEVITWHAKHFFTWQASIPPAACPKQRLSLVIWIQLVDGSLSNNRLHSSLKPVFVTKSLQNCHKVAHVDFVMCQEWQNCDKKRFLWSHGSVTSIKCWLDFGSSKSVTPQPASLHSNWP